jgi:hypothetical protein
MSNSRRIRHAAATRADVHAATQDVRYFQQHPNQYAYTRAATEGERKQYGQPPGTLVRVFRLSPWQHARAFVPANVRVN